MARYRNAALIASWAAFILILVREADGAPVAENFWINLAYVVGIFSIGIASWIGLIILFAHLVGRKPFIFFTAATVVVFGLIAVESHWLRNWVAQWF